MKSCSRIWSLGFSIWMLLSIANGQVTIDTTGPIQIRHREPVAGSSGSAGRRLPLQLDIKVTDMPESFEGWTPVVVKLKNIGSGEITIPISPNPGEFEPSDPKIAYTVQCLTLYFVSETGNKDNKRSVVLPGGADLYGEQKVAGTLIKLKPGEAVDVRTRVRVPKQTELAGANLLIGNVSLYTETVIQIEGRLKSAEEEIGSASSVQFPSTLFR